MSGIMHFTIWVFCGIINFIILARIINMKKIEDDDDRSMLPMCIIFGTLGLVVVLGLAFINGTFITGPIERYINSILRLINKEK